MFKEDWGDNSKINYPKPQDSSDKEDEEERKEATLGISEHFANIESVVDNENGLGLLPTIDEQEEQEYFDQNRWCFFVGGTEDLDAVTVFENHLADLGLDVVGSNNRDLVLFLYSGKMAIIMKENKLKKHADSGEILENDRETGENFYKFLRFQLDKGKKTIHTILQYSGSFEGFKDYLSNMTDTEEQWELDNSSFCLFQIFCHLLQ